MCVCVCVCVCVYVCVSVGCEYISFHLEDHMRSYYPVKFLRTINQDEK